MGDLMGICCVFVGFGWSKMVAGVLFGRRSEISYVPSSGLFGIGKTKHITIELKQYK